MRRRGFTLIEMMVAISLVALVVVALDTFIFSMSELWVTNRGPRFFDQHVRTLTRYLSNELRTAALPPNVMVGATTAAIGWQDVPSQSGGQAETLLTFKLPAGSRLLPWPSRALPDVVCALAVRPQEGLVLLWHSQYEVNYNTDPPRETLLSPLVTGISYDYYDSTATPPWSNSTTPLLDSSGQAIVPSRIRLTFAYQNLTNEVAITLPVATQGLPPY